MLRADGNPLAALGEERVAAMVDGMRNHDALLRDYEPSPFRGRMVLFTAVAGQDEQTTAEKVARWSSHVDGPIDVYRINCAHDDMMSAEPLAQAGVVVTAELETWLIEDQVPRVVRLARLGHKRKDVDDNYSHVTDVMIARMLAGLQRRWEEDGGWTWERENGPSAA